MSYLKVVDHNDLVRDPDTGAIINIDKVSSDAVKNGRNVSFVIKKLQSDVEELKSELFEIKKLLRELIRHGN